MCCVDTLMPPSRDTLARHPHATLARHPHATTPSENAPDQPPHGALGAPMTLLISRPLCPLTGSVKLADLKAEDYDAVFLPGGHGVCWDFPGGLQPCHYQ